ncbi:MAG: AAA family ATPase, partial [Streptosporangiales bacterium]|nr:AAA family ATPase [Streptosporangiales bacterium]
MSAATHPDPARPDTDDDPELASERAHLTASRAALRAMRANVLGLEAMGGDPVSTEYLKADLHRRAEALRDDPRAPLFFGRLDRTSGETFHVGRRHVHDAAGDALVIDWRAPVSRAFYRATRADPMEMDRRRRFGCSGGDLTGYEDEDLTSGGPDPGRSRILIEEIERPRVGPMRDVVATIQPEQDDIVRAPADVSVCVQGAPGTGKTAVGLHRIAYLLYAHAERMRRGGVLVIGPNPAFLGYIRHVLPALGEAGVAQTTLAGLVARVPVRGTDTPEAARIKGDARLAEVLHRALWNTIREPDEALVLPRGARRWRVPAYELSGLITELRGRGVAFGSGRTLLAGRIAHVVLTRMEQAGEACDDRTHDAVARSRPVRALVDRIWPRADPKRLVFRLLADPAALAEAAAGLLEPTEQAAIAWPKPPRGPGSARWTAADAVLIDEAAGLIEREPSLAHIVVDEAQDLSPMQCRAIGRRCVSGSVTVLGDIAQATTPSAGRDWPTTLRHLGKTDALHEELRQGYRVPRQILDFAARLLPHIAPELLPPASVREMAGALHVRRVDDVPAAAVREAVAALAEPGSV